MRLRARLAGMWASVAGGWGAARRLRRRARGASAAADARAGAAPGAGDRVLELACGPGGLGLAAAERVGAERRGRPDRRRRGDDRDRRRAGQRAGRRATSPSARLDLERIDEPDAAYDVVLCREGLMFALEPAARRGEIRRVLRPGGRVALAVWGPARAQPVARARHRRRQRAARRAGAAARHPRPVRARRRRRAGTASSTAPAWPTCASASSRCRCAAPRSTSGGSGPRRWPVRCRRSSRGCPTRRCRRCATGPRCRARVRDRVGRPRPPGRGVDRLGPARLAPRRPRHRDPLSRRWAERHH